MKNTVLKLLISCLFLSCTDTPDSIKKDISDADKIYGLSTYWYYSKLAFPYLDQTSVDLDSAYVEFIPRVLKTNDTWEYYRELKKFAKLLKDGHSDVGNYEDITHPDHLMEHPAPNYLPVKFSVINSKMFVKDVRLNELNAPAVGSELIKVDDIEIGTYLRDVIFPITISGTEQELWYEASLQVCTYGLRDTIQKKKLTFKAPNGKLVNYYTKIKKYGEWKNEEKWAPFKYKKLENDIAYLQINTFSNDSLIKVFPLWRDELLKMNGVIIDVRENSGGNTDIAAEILKYFTEKDTLIGAKIKTLEHRPSYLAARVRELPNKLDSYSKEDIKYYKEAYNMYQRNHWHDQGVYSIPNDVEGPKIKSPLIVLTGNHTISAAEDFLVLLDSNLKNRSTKIGDVSFGSTGQPLFFGLPGGGLGRVVSVHNSYPDGKEFVGYGIEPDIYTKQSVEDLINGNDVVLKKAVELIRNE